MTAEEAKKAADAAWIMRDETPAEDVGTRTILTRVYEATLALAVRLGHSRPVPVVR